jgi:hypothetical protein
MAHSPCAVARILTTRETHSILLFALVITAAGRATAEDELAPEPKNVHGIVVDDSDKPADDASIRIITNEEVFVTRTADDGSFKYELPPRENLWRLVVIASDSDLKRLGVHRYPNIRDGKIEHAKIVLRPTREITGRVLDANDQPQGGVLVAGVSSYTKLNETVSGDDGEFTLLVPKDSQMSSVVAYSPERGLDYFLFRRKDGLKDNPFPLPYDHSEPIEFRLNGMRKVTVRVQDVDGNPLPNTHVAPWYFEKPRKGGDLNSGLEEFNSKTDENGNATVLVPEDVSTKVTIWARLDRYHSPDRWVHDPEDDDRNVVATLEKMVTMSGLIVGAARRPLEGITCISTARRTVSMASTRSSRRMRKGVFNSM